MPRVSFQAKLSDVVKTISFIFRYFDCIACPTKCVPNGEPKPSPCWGYPTRALPNHPRALPNHPRALPDYQHKTALPDYQHTTALPDYQHNGLDGPATVGLSVGGSCTIILAFLLTFFCRKRMKLGKLNLKLTFVLVMLRLCLF
jgi:hypothetical protein